MKSSCPNDYRNNVKPTWCAGCSYYGVLVALTEVFAQQQIAPHACNVISGIGCSSRMPLYLNTFGMHTLHGRAIPVAIGARLANPDVPVVVVGGDGDFFSIGIGHFVHAARKNFNLTVICMDNRMYAMTKNQASPTSVSGYRGTLTPFGKLSVPLNVIEFAIACDATFVSRTFAGSQQHMQSTLTQAFLHQGFSLVEIIAPCRTFDRTTSLTTLAPRIKDINFEEHHDPYNKETALSAAVKALRYDLSPDAEIPVGVFWRNQTSTFEEQVAAIKQGNSHHSTIEAIIEEYTL